MDTSIGQDATRQVQTAMREIILRVSVTYSHMFRTFHTIQRNLQGNVCSGTELLCYIFCI